VTVAASRRGRKKPSLDSTDNVVPFPPLPPVPRAPRFPVDVRQARTTRILGRLVGVAEGSMRLAGPNFTTGFHASAVDLGRLQAALARGIARLDGAQVEARWDEVFGWMMRVLRAWVQRYKSVRIKRDESGIRVEIETQDDHGYYSYGFDVFPRTSGKARRISPIGD
jgi:hypothetical protein